MDTRIRIVAEGSNEQGDLLTRLASDLFFTWGYEDFLFNVHKTGRELDLIASHRHEPRGVIAEFKSGAEPAGGSDVNKFVGALDAQRRRSEGKPVHGYFISLAGFKSTAVEQERELSNDRVVLLDGRDVLRELVKGGIIVSEAKAMLAAQTLLNSSSDLEIEDDPALIGHSLGWIWAVCYKSRGQRTTTCLIHADGSPVTLSAAREVMDIARRSHHPLADLRLANKTQRLPDFRSVKKRYLAFLQQEFGGITLEGLPADQAIGSGQFKLEALYVPLHLIHAFPQRVKNAEGSSDSSLESFTVQQDDSKKDARMSVSSVISENIQVAILGLPGSGKTTLLKRLAVAYADPARLKESADQLPNVRWFPVVIKCRQLRAEARSPILKIIGDQVELAEMPDSRDDFVAMVSRELLSGNLLLLVDGLDEIASPSDRAYFVAQLRTFIGVYPMCRLIVTSREAGFRSVAASVSSICQGFKVADLSDEAIRRLVSSWHSEVVGKSAAVEKKAVSLAEAIITTNRVRSLAVNPLLLTILLLVQRWMGELPRRRSVLYDKAIEVLLMTWNIEGHEPLDKDEVLPQLGYTAFSMMAVGKASVSVDELIELLISARQDLPEILSYARMSVHEFVDRVEERSSLMTISGHEIVDGKLRPSYGFKHLTFQEYLAALAVVEGWLDEELRDHGVAEVLSKYLDLEAWQEVVTLASVLSGRRASHIVAKLSERLDRALTKKESDPKSHAKHSQLFVNLLGCLRDEASLTPEQAHKAIDLCIRGSQRYSQPDDDVVASALYGGKYDQLARAVALDNLKAGSGLFATYGGVVSGFGFKDCMATSDASVAEWICSKLENRVLEQRIYGAATMMRCAHSHATKDKADYELASATEFVVDRLTESPIRRNAETFHYMWALAWAMPVFGPSEEAITNRLQIRLLEIWRGSRNADITRVSSWALSSTPFVGTWTLNSQKRDEYLRFAETQSNARGVNSDTRRRAAMVIQRYLLPARGRTALIKDIGAQAKTDHFGISREFYGRILKSLGSAGQAALAEMDKEREGSASRRSRVRRK